ncbi:MAG: hypothetical protein KC502_21115 [Myxococcales bacterium]|nr:hypothetical protein [Myxococcales bacterium]
MTELLPLGKPQWTGTLRIPGLKAPDGLTTPRERRQWLHQRTDAELGQLLSELMERLRGMDRGELTHLATWLRAPFAEVMASPFGLRACAFGAQVGAMVVQHELRTLLPWAPDLVGDDATLDEDHGHWTRGSLHAGRYQSFQLDGAFATFVPDHSARWTPHELLHRAVGYAWRADMSRWEAYQCARLAELLPVVHWYGPDLVSRLDETQFDRDEDARMPRASLERTRWLDKDATVAQAHLAATLTHLRTGITRFEEELAACTAERTGGLPVGVTHGLLDSRADATAYITGHHGRLRAERIAELLDTGGLTTAYPTAAALSDAVERTFDTLLFGEIALDPTPICAAAHGRLLWEVTHRAVHCSTWSPSALLPDLQTAWQAAASGDPTPAADTLSQLVDNLPAHLRDDIACVGIPVSGLGADDGMDMAQLEAGLESAVPGTYAWLNEEGTLPDLVGALAEHPSRGPLVQRLAELLGDPVQKGPGQKGPVQSDPIARGLLAFETRVLGATRRDDTAERLAQDITALPTDGNLLPSAAFSSLQLNFDAGELAFSLTNGGGWDGAMRPSQWLIGETGGGVAAIACPPALAQWWRTLPAAADEAVQSLVGLADDDQLGDLDALEWLSELSAANAVAWLPAVS